VTTDLACRPIPERWIGRSCGTLRALGLLVLAVSLLPVSAAADEATEQEARRLFEDGVAALQREDYATALVAFQRARELSDRPILLYNIGMCHRALLQYPEAIQAFREFLGEMNTDPSSAETRRQVVELIADMEANLSNVTVLVGVDGASVYLDSELIGTAPLARPVQVGPGSHVLEARKPGYRDAHVPFDVMAGEDTQVQLSLDALPSTGLPPPVGPVGPQPEPEDDGGVASEWWFWTIIGVVVAGGAVTAGVLLWPEDEGPSADWAIHGL